MGALSADVVVIGSGMGGATTALALARRGVDVLRARARASGCRASRRTGRRSAVFVERRYKPAERWLRRRRARRSRPACTTSSAATRRSTARACRGCASATSARSSTSRAPRRPGRSPTPTSSRTTPRPSGSTASTARPARTRPSRGAAAPFPFPALPHEPYVADLAERLRAQGVHPSANAMGVDLRPGGALRALPRRATGSRACVGAKSDAETCARRPGARDRATRGWRPACACGGSSPTRSGRRVDHLVAEGPDGAGRGHAAGASCSRPAR